MTGDGYFAYLGLSFVSSIVVSAGLHLAIGRLRIPIIVIAIFLPIVAMVFIDPGASILGYAFALPFSIIGTLIGSAFAFAIQSGED